MELVLEGTRVVVSVLLQHSMTRKIHYVWRNILCSRIRRRGGKFYFQEYFKNTQGNKNKVVYYSFDVLRRDSVLEQVKKEMGNKLFLGKAKRTIIDLLLFLGNGLS